MPIQDATVYADADQLLTPGLMSETKKKRLLDLIGFNDPETATTRLAEICQDAEERNILGPAMNTLLISLSEAATPDGSLVNFERFVQSVPNRKGLFEYLAQNPRAVEILVKLFVGSQFLTEILLRNPDYLIRLTQHKGLSEFKDLQQFVEEQRTTAAELELIDDKLDAIRRYQHWELLRIGACDAFGLLDLRSVTVQLSLLADSIVQSCLRLIGEDLEIPTTGFAALAFGKLGGEELNYSSDIDLVFLADKDASRFWKLGQRLIKALMDSTNEGFLYRVDMRLRPWGRSGALVNTVKAHIDYLEKHGMTWEKQALIKARIIAGDTQVGTEFLNQTDQLIYSIPPNEIRDNIRKMKEKIENRLEQQGREWSEVKLSAGSIRDIEFVTQCLQLLHGSEYPGIRHFTTQHALIRLADHHFINAEEYRRLSTGYIFLRTVEHALQLMHYKQTHHLPDSDREISYLARRLDYPSSQQFLKQYEEHRQAIRSIYAKYVLNETLTKIELPTSKSDSIPDLSTLTVATSYKQIFSQEQIDQHIQLMKKLSHENLVELQVQKLSRNRYELTLTGFNLMGGLSVVCGLLFVYGFNIESGVAFSNLELSPQNEVIGHTCAEESKLKNIWVFQLESPPETVQTEVWKRYAQDLESLMSEIKQGNLSQVQGELAKKVARALQKAPALTEVLYPVEIGVDNEASPHSTVLSIESEDTLGFMYELSNALSLSGIHIGRVLLKSVENTVHDTIFVTSAEGEKITDPKQQEQLRAAIVLIKHFTHLLPLSPNPEAALLHFREFVAHLFDQPDWVREFSSLENREVLDALAKLLGVSDFLWEDFLRLQHTNLFPVIQDAQGLKVSKSKQQLMTELKSELEQESEADRESTELQREVLNGFKDREMFRIDMRHILNEITEFGEFSAELSDLAETVIEVASQLCLEQLFAKYGTPMLESGEPCEYAVCALGKCGGRELGFASDIELMFLYEGNGKTSGPKKISNQEFFQHWVEMFKQMIRARQEGIFQLDLRLRPYGKAGSLAVSLEAFEKYFSSDGPAWPYERQALVKLRPISGAENFCQQIVDLRDSLIYHGPKFDATAMRAMREKQVRQLVKGGTLNAKLSPGGLVDVEYLIQGLQINYGVARKSLRATNTREALKELHETGIISPENFERLKSALFFHRRLIDALRMVRGSAKDLSIPEEETEEFEFLARRLGYREDIQKLSRDMETAFQTVQELSRSLM